MRISIKLLLCIGLVMISVSVFFGRCPAQESSAVQDMIRRERPEVEEARQELEKFIAGRPEKARELERKTAGLNQELRRLLLVHSVAESSPIEYRIILKKMKAMKGSAVKLAAPVYEAIRNVSDFEKFLKERKEEYGRLGEDALLPESARISRDYTKELDRLLALTIAAKQVLTVAPHGVEDFLLKLERRRSAVETDLGDAWRTYFFMSLPKTFLSSDAWKYAFLGAGKWAKFVPLFGFLPQEGQARDFRNFILAILVSGVAGSILSYFLLVWLGRKTDRADGIRHFLPFALWTVFGLSVMVNTALSESLRFGSYEPVGELFLAAGFISLAWNVRRVSFEQSRRRGHNIFWPLWCLFAAGIMVQMLRMPMITMTPAFALLLFLAGGYYFIVKRRLKTTLERRMAVSTAVLCVVLAVTALSGFGSLAVLASALWFMVTLGFELGSGLNRFFGKTIQSGREASTGMILFGNMMLPLVFIGLFALTVIWASIYVSGVPLLRTIVDWKLDWGIFSLRAATLLSLAALFFIARSLIAFLHTAITFVRRRKEGIEEGVIKSLQTVSSYVVWFCYVLVSLNLLGVGIGNLTLIAGGLSVGVGFAFQDLIRNFVSGLMLLFGRSIHPGDEIQLEDVHGRVERINIRSTVVQTNDDSTVFLPNFDLVSKKVVNWTHRDPKGRAEIVVGVAYGSDTRLIRSLLIECALANPDVLKEPPPYVLFHDFGDNALVFSLRFWIMHVILAKDKIRSAIRYEIERIFQERGIEISYPQKDLYPHPAKPELKK